MLKLIIITIFFLFALDLALAHFPVYSLYKERKPVDLFRALQNARQSKRRAGGFGELYDVPLSPDY